jgi:TorA maturation chaperone TorD
MPDKMAAEWSAISSLLGNIYLCKPTREAIKNWKELLSTGSPSSLSELKEAIDRIDLCSEQELEDLLWEFTRLFIGPYKLPCAPWESVYLSAKRLLRQEVHEEVMDFYAQVGLAIRTPDVMADHIGAELNFLSVLLGRIDLNPKKRLYYINAVRRFLDEHLKRWIPHFTRDMEEAATLPLYKALARITRDFILTECNSLDQETA